MENGKSLWLGHTRTGHGLRTTDVGPPGTTDYGTRTTDDGLRTTEHGLRTTATDHYSNFGFMIERELDQRVRAVKVEFLADVCAVIFDCSIADKQFGADFLARFCFGDQSQYSQLCRREVANRGLPFDEARGPVPSIQEDAGKRGADVMLARTDRAHTVDDVRQSAVF